jgi:membrane fusion protein, multidrug efflux system
MTIVPAKFPIYFGFAFAGLVGAVSLTGCDRAISDASAQPAQKKSEAAPVPVALATVERGPIERPLRAGGILRQKSELDLAFTVGGVVSALRVDEGAVVRRGQVLAELDATEVGAAVAQSREAVAKADRDLSRVKSLHTTGSLPLVDLQNAETGAAVARAQLAAADFASRHAVIVAPDDGVIDQRLAEKGEVLSPGRPVFRMSGRSKGAVVRVALIDKDALALTVGQPAEVQLDAAPDVRLPAKISTLATVASPATGTFDVEVKLDAPPKTLLSGMTVKVTIPRTETPHATIPMASLVRADGKNAFVYLVVDGHAKRAPVTVLFLTGDRAALAAGLDGVDRIVGAGAALLEDGVAVDVRP